MTAAHDSQQGVSTSGGLTVNVSARPVPATAQLASQTTGRPVPVVEVGGRAEDLTQLLRTVTALVSVPAAGIAGLLLSGPQACVTAAGVAGAVAVYGEHVSRYPRRRMPSPAARAALCAHCASTQVGVVSARSRRFPARTLLRAWCGGCWTRHGRATQVDALWWLPASFTGTWDALDDVVDELLPEVCSSCDGQQGPIGFAVWAQGTSAAVADLLCASCARVSAASRQDGEQTPAAAPLGGFARTGDELRGLVEAAHVVRRPIFDVVDGVDVGAGLGGGGGSR